MWFATSYNELLVLVLSYFVHLYAHISPLMTFLHIFFSPIVSFALLNESIDDCRIGKKIESWSLVIDAVWVSCINQRDCVVDFQHVIASRHPRYGITTCKYMKNILWIIVYLVSFFSGDPQNFSESLLKCANSGRPSRIRRIFPTGDYCNRFGEVLCCRFHLLNLPVMKRKMFVSRIQISTTSF